MFYSKNKIIQILGEILKYKKIYNIVISPGSRNAPIIIHFTQQKSFKTYSVVDERSAAYFAIGISQSLDRTPIVINCTSGSAVANYYPAVTEAFYQDIPLILLTADRPKEFIDLFEGQTIRQENLFRNHTVKSIQLTEDDSIKGLIYNQRIINETINESIIKKKPVHINIPISEPLYDIVYNIKPLEIKNINRPNIKCYINNINLNKLKKIWCSFNKKMILIGQDYYNHNLKEILIKISCDPSVIILTETLSNINNENFISYIDRIIIPMEQKEWNIFAPDILITLGKNLISKKIKFLLRNSKILHHWHINTLNGQSPDTYQKLTMHFNLYPENILKIFQKFVNKNSNYKKIWNNINIYRQKKHDYYLNNIKFSDMKVLDIIFSNIPNNIILQLGNSTVIRYQQYLNHKYEILTYSNRGTSGIDGTLSTAIGYAIGQKHPVTLIIGDISFFYSSNSLWNKYIPKNFRIIVINNGGGNIFRIIYDSKKKISLDDYFETRHVLNAKNICKTYKIKYYLSNNIKKLNYILKKFWKNSKTPILLEINTKKCNNENILKKYFKYINS